MERSWNASGSRQRFQRRLSRLHRNHHSRPRLGVIDQKALGRVFDEVRVEPVTFHNDLVNEERTDWLFLAR